MSLACFYTGLFIALLIAFTESNSNEGKIMGGQKITIDQVPSLVSLQVRFGESSFDHLCGGTLVTPKFVITAAQCLLILYRNPNEELQMQIRVGSSLTTGGGQTCKIKAVNFHPKYYMSSYDYDISIIELEEEVLISTEDSMAPQIAVISKIAEDSLPREAMFYTAGWGNTNYEDGWMSEDLLGVTLPHVEREDCKPVLNYYKITPRMVCAGYKEGGKDACLWDEGGPLYYQGELYGIVSFNDGCGKPDRPGIYTYILDPEIKAFIDETIKSS